MALKAAECPEELCRAYATLVVKIFKTTLQMEWWRAILKKEEVSEAQLRWLASKEKRQLHQSRHSLEGFTKSLDGGQRGGQFWPNGRTIKEKAQRTGE